MAEKTEQPTRVGSINSTNSSSPKEDDAGKPQPSGGEEDGYPAQSVVVVTMIAVMLSVFLVSLVQSLVASAKGILLLIHRYSGSYYHRYCHTHHHRSFQLA